MTPNIALSIVSAILETNVADVKFLDLQLEVMDQKHFLEKLERYSPNIIVTLLSIYSISDDRWYAELPIPTVAVLTPTTIDPVEAIEKYSLTSKYFTVGDTTETSIHNAILELNSKGRIDGVKGLLVRSSEGLKYGGKVIERRIEDPPSRAHEVIPIKQYLRNQRRRKTIYLYTSKGCHYRCAFCTVGGLEFKYTGNSAEQIVDYIAFLVDRYGVREFLFSDADFTSDIERTKAFGRMLVSRGLKISYSINATVNRLSEELIDLLCSSGCTEIRIGIETVNKSLLTYLRKGFNVEKARELVKHAIGKKINVLLYFTTGIPGETKSDILQNVDFILDTGVNTFTNGPLFPIPSTTLYNQLKTKNQLFDKEWSEYYLGNSLHFKNKTYKSMFRIKAIQWWMRFMCKIQKVCGRCKMGSFRYYVYNILAECSAPFLILAYRFYREADILAGRIRKYFNRHPIDNRQMDEVLLCSSKGDFKCESIRR